MIRELQQLREEIAGLQSQLLAKRCVVTILIPRHCFSKTPMQPGYRRPTAAALAGRRTSE